MSKTRIATMIMGLTLLFAGAATAGLKTSTGIRFAKNADGSGIGEGSIGQARADANGQTMLYCYNYPSYSACVLYNGATNIFLSCLTYDSNLISMIRSINSDSFVTISSDASGYCTSVGFYTGSQYAPKTL